MNTRNAQISTTNARVHLFARRAFRDLQAHAQRGWRLPALSAGQAGVKAGGEKDAGPHEDIPGFCKSATLEEVREHGHVLTPGRYVGAAPQADDGEPFEEKMKRLTATLREQQAEAARLDAAIEANLKALGY